MVRERVTRIVIVLIDFFVFCLFVCLLPLYPSNRSEYQAAREKFGKGSVWAEAAAEEEEEL